MVCLQRARSLWLRWLRHQAPAGKLLSWKVLHRLGLLLLCVAVSTTASLPWLLKPDLQPGALAPFDSVAPKDALVRDTTALEQRRSNLVARSVVQVIDPEQTRMLLKRLDSQLAELHQLNETGSAARIGPVNLTKAEQLWLEQLEPDELNLWEEAIRKSAKRMLSQGLVSTVAGSQLREAASLQLDTIPLDDPAARSLGSKLLASSLEGRSNLRTDPALSRQLIEEQLTKQGIPTIEVSGSISGCREYGNNLKQAVSSRISQGIKSPITSSHAEENNGKCDNQNDAQISSEFDILKNFASASQKNQIQQREICARQDHEDDRCVLN